MARHAAPYLSAAAGAAFAALFAASPTATAAAQEWQPDARHLDCAAEVLSNADFSSFAPSSSEIFLGVDEDGNITVAKSATNFSGKEASVVITFLADEILAKAFHPGKPDFENDDFWAMEIIRLKNGMLVSQWWTTKPDPPLGLTHRDFTQRRWALDTSRNVADELRSCLNLQKKTQHPSKPPIKKQEPLDRTLLELGQR